MSGGGGFDPGKELAQLDKDLSLSQNAPTIAAAVAAFYGAPYLMESIGAASTAGAGAGAGAAGAGIADLAAYDAMAGLTASAAAPAAAPAAAAAAAGAELAATGAGAAEAAAAMEAAGAVPAAVPTAATSAVPGVDAIGSGMNTQYVGQQASMIPSVTPPATPGLPSLFDQATTAYGKLNPVAKYGIPLAAAAMYADRNKGGTPEQKPYDGPLNQLKYDPNRYSPLEVKPPTPYTPVYKDYRNMAGGGLADLGDYADYARGGRMLKGPGDGMSDSIPAVIAGKQPARLANDEFVVSADVVSHLGNGSSDAGAKQLYKMMDRVRAARTGKQAQAKQINPTKYMPA